MLDRAKLNFRVSRMHKKKRPKRRFLSFGCSWFRLTTPTANGSTIHVYKV